MRTASLRPGDVVEVDVRGRVFPARVRDLHPADWSPGHIEVEPLVDGITYFHPTRRQIKRQLRRVA